MATEIMMDSGSPGFVLSPGEYSRMLAEVDAAARLRAENETLRSRIHEAVEVYAGMEGVPVPETACEAYLLRILEQMMTALAKE